MHKADLVLAALATAALVATGVGLLRSDDWSGERTVTFEEAQAPLAAMGPNATSSVPARFAWDAPANATGVRVTVTVDFAGQAVQGGAAIVTLRGTAPNGDVLPAATYTLPIGQGATSAHGEFDFNRTWLETPEAVRDTRMPEGHAWWRPFVLEVVVERPSDLPAAEYGFTSAVAGTFTAYAAA